MYKLLALDLDGTLLNEKKEISAKNKETLKKAQGQGCQIVLTTGRPLKAVSPYVENLELFGPNEYAITFNGGLVQRIATGEILGKTVLEFSDIQKVYPIFKDLDLPLSVLSEGRVLEFATSKNHPSIYPQLNPLLTYENVTLEDLDPTAIYNKLVSATEAEVLDEKIPFIPTDLKEKFGIMKSRTCLLEILPKEVSKARGLELLGERLGISLLEMMAFGDEENDLSMIEACGLGVVMANGSDKVKEAADFITLSNEEDGVAYAIEKFILKGGN